MGVRTSGRGSREARKASGDASHALIDPSRRGRWPGVRDPGGTPHPWKHLGVINIESASVKQQGIYDLATSRANARCVGYSAPNCTLGLWLLLLESSASHGAPARTWPVVRLPSTWGHSPRWISHTSDGGAVHVCCTTYSSPGTTQSGCTGECLHIHHFWFLDHCKHFCFRGTAVRSPTSHLGRTNFRA